MFLAFFAMNNLFCQNFTFKSENPFGIKTIKDDDSRPTQKVMFFDYDGDGDLDILHSGIASLDDVENFEWSNVHYFLEIQENIGDAHNPQFGPRQSIFENFPFPEGYFFPWHSGQFGEKLLINIYSGKNYHFGTLKLE